MRAEEFDAVVCCVGTYHDPNLPDVKGMAAFPGRQLHCHNYRHNASFKGETVLVVGASFSGQKQDMFDHVHVCSSRIAKENSEMLASKH
jgi:cation diffusion facilitator CzcD-associated flavoprotein CzcO